jgi:site-specific DNA recombinase
MITHPSNNETLSLSYYSKLFKDIFYRKKPLSITITHNIWKNKGSVQMTRAYLYIRVSTDEQKRKGYSLPEQEDHLLKHCKFNNIEVAGIYQEDFSAKNFNRPEWKKLLTAVKKDSKKKETNILFVKWDRFSRNIEYAYEMIGILRNFNTTAMAVDQPIDFTVPESTVMLAIYLSIPEAENNRRSLNTSNGIKRAKMMGRYPNKAPLGFINCTAFDGKKEIVHVQPAADIIKWAFKQLAKNSFTIETVRRMAFAKGLKSSRSAFWKLVRNPVYCGLIPISAKDRPQELIKGIHEPLISESLFNEVQAIINTRRKITCKSDELNNFFFLKGFLVCPSCGRTLRASFSRGSTKAYPYYHCSDDCKMRIKAELLNDSYCKRLQELQLSDETTELFGLIMEDLNIRVQKIEYLNNRRLLTRQLEEQQSALSKVRKLFAEDRLDFDDFKELKKEYQTISNNIGIELNSNSGKLRLLEKQFQVADRSFTKIFHSYSELDIVDKKYILSLMTPTISDFRKGTVSIQLNRALLNILSFKMPVNTFEALSLNTELKSFTEKKVPVKLAIATMAKNNIQISETYAVIILDFLYRMAKTYDFKGTENSRTISRYRTNTKLRRDHHKPTF